MRTQFYMRFVLLAVFLHCSLMFQACTDEANTSPVILQAIHHGGSNSCGFLFYADNTYEWTNGSGLGVSSEKGTYTLKGSLITLDRSQIDKSIVSKYLLIRKQKTSWNNDENVTYVFQINESSEIIKNATPFIVYIDLRREK